jgi:hypothetical protein
MFKIGSHDPFEHLKHKLWPKEKPGIKLVVWLPTTKSRESTLFPYVQVMCDLVLEFFFNEGYNFIIDLITIRGLHAKLCTSKVARIPTMGISRFPFGSPGTKTHLDVKN